MIREMVAVGAGGALGSVVRYLVASVALSGQSVCGLPAGTLAVNLSGSLLIGLLMQALAGSPLLWLLAVGFCGGFTTFSTFSAELVALLRAGNLAAAALYAAVSVGICAAGVCAGAALGGVLKRGTV